MQQEFDLFDEGQDFIDRTRSYEEAEPAFGYLDCDDCRRKVAIHSDPHHMVLVLCEDCNGGSAMTLYGKDCNGPEWFPEENQWEPCATHGMECKK